MKLLNANKEPRNLTLLMCASALRYAGEPTRENLDKADMWADHAISALLDAVYRHFGAGKLMVGTGMLLSRVLQSNRDFYSVGTIILDEASSHRLCYSAPVPQGE